MVTYILESRGYYKIGKSQKLEERLADYNNHNPCYELIHVIDFDCEAFLHMHFFDKKYKFEWYTLSEEDVQWIKSNEDILNKNTYEILENKRKQEINLEKERKKQLKREKRLETARKEILKRQLEDKEQEEWLLKRIKECPECFS